MSNQIADSLGVDMEQSRQMPDIVMAESFFTKLAELGITTDDQNEQLQLWQIGELLEHQERKVASQPKHTLVSAGLSLLQQATKTASDSRPAQELRADFNAEVSSKTAAFLSNPVYFAHGLALFTEQAAANR